MNITSIGMSAPLDHLSLPRATAPSDPHSKRESMETVGGIIIVLGCNAAALCITSTTVQLQLAPKTIIIIIGIASSYRQKSCSACVVLSLAVDVLNPVTRSLGSYLQCQ